MLAAAIPAILRDDEKQVFRIYQQRAEDNVAERREKSSMKRVLIVDDEMLLAMALRAQFEREGYEVIGIANNGLEAVRICETASPDVVIMDIQMPEMNGVDATRHLMENCPVPVVVLTGYSQFVQPAEQAGAMGYAIKPLNARQIPQLLQAAGQRFARYQTIREQAEDDKAALAEWLLVQQAVQGIAAKSEISEEQAAQRLQERAEQSRMSLVQAAEEALR